MTTSDYQRERERVTGWDSVGKLYTDQRQESTGGESANGIPPSLCLKSKKPKLTVGLTLVYQINGEAAAHAH